MKFDISNEELRSHSLFVGLPMYGGQCFGETAKSLIELGILFNNHGIPLRFHFLFNESLITRARNYISDEFLRSGYTHLMFIDSDVGFDPQDIMTLFSMSIKKYNNCDVIGGVYPRKGIAWEKVRKASLKGVGKVNPYELEDYTADYVFNFDPNDTGDKSLGEPIDVMEFGTGFMMIPRYVFEGFQKHYPLLTCKPDHVRTEHFDGSREIHLFFDTVVDPETKRYLSEDYYFCQYIRKIGYKVSICPWMKLSHNGTYSFKGDIHKIAQLGSSLTATQNESMTEIKKRIEKDKKKVKIKRR